MIDSILIFVSAFISATLLPFYSEALVVTTLINQPENWLIIWLTASLGNTLGAAVNWLMGRYLLHFKDHRWFPVKLGESSKAHSWYDKYGVWSLLLAWAPIIGDAFPFIAGIMRVRFALFFLLTFTGKSIRYLVVIYLTNIAMF